MKTTRKLLLTLIVTVMLSICFGTTAFASELDTIATLPVQTITEGTEDTDITDNTDNTDIADNTDNTDDTDNTIDGQSNDATPEDELSGEVSEEEKDVILEEGYYLDEQGQVYYKDPNEEVEEQIIEDITEDTEDTEDIEDTEKEEKEKPVVKKPSYSEKDLRLLASLIYAEAGNQPYNGMLGVANVVINRKKSDVYWHVDTIEEVIYDHKWSVQFAVTIKSKKTGLSMLDKALKYYDTRKFSGSNAEAQKKAMNRAIKAAKSALEGNNNIGNYFCFQNKRSASSIKKKYSDTKIIADHIFYRTK